MLRGQGHVSVIFTKYYEYGLWCDMSVLYI